MTLRIATVVCNIEPMTYNEYFNEAENVYDEPGYLIEDIEQSGRWGIEYTGEAQWHSADKVDDLYKYPTDLCFSHALWFAKHFGSSIFRASWGEDLTLSITNAGPDSALIINQPGHQGITPYTPTQSDLMSNDWRIIRK